MNLILGTANFGNDYSKRLEKEECFKILDLAKELGVWAIDTAPSYGESEDIIKEWIGNNLSDTRKLLVFSKATRSLKNKVGDIILLHDENELFLPRVSYDGASLYNPDFMQLLDKDDWIQAPFNPLNLQFKSAVSRLKFIARSIFVGGKVYGLADRKAVAKLTFGFLRSHNVKNVVFGVDSLEDLEINVDAARDNKVYDTRFF